MSDAMCEECEQEVSVERICTGCDAMMCKRCYDLHDCEGEE